MLGDEAANAAQRLAPALARSLACSGAAHVVLGDPALWAGALDRLELDAELLRHPPDQRRRSHPGRGLAARLGGGRCGLGARLLFLHRGCRPVFADHDQDGADGNDVALGDEDPRNLAGSRRGDLDRRLVGLHLDQRVVLGDLLPLGDEPAGDLALGQPLAEVGQLELVGHA